MFDSRQTIESWKGKSQNFIYKHRKNQIKFELGMAHRQQRKRIFRICRNRLVTMSIDNQTIEIIDFTNELCDPIKSLNYEWLEKYFRVEEGDVVSLSNPKKYIIDKGGFIFYAKLDNKIVGTVSLLKRADTIYELGKMAVTDSAKGLGIGTILLEHCLYEAKQKQIKTLILYSNTILQSAMHLYRKYGFEEVELESDLYERANIKMEKHL